MRTLVRYAANEITRIGMDFYEADLVGSLSATCLGCLLSAGISHIFDTASTEASIRSEGLQKLHQSKRLFQEFSDAHTAADWCTGILDKIYTEVQKQMPASADHAPPPSGVGPSHSIQVQQEAASHSAVGETLTIGAKPDNTIGNSAGSVQMNGPLATTTLGSFPGEDQFQAIEAFGQPPNLGPLVAAQPPGFPNDFTNILGLGDMWLDFAGMVNPNASMDWMRSDTFWGSEE